MRGIEFAQLTAFVAVAEHASFTKAATNLGVAARRYGPLKDKLLVASRKNGADAIVEIDLVA